MPGADLANTTSPIFMNCIIEKQKEYSHELFPRSVYPNIYILSLPAPY